MELQVDAPLVNPLCRPGRQEHCGGGRVLTGKEPRFYVAARQGDDLRRRGAEQKP